MREVQQLEGAELLAEAAKMVLERPQAAQEEAAKVEEVEA
jgi:hypothetical protein